MAATSRRIHGTSSACIWRSGYRVFALDQRGHGDSEWARDVDLHQSRDVGGCRGVHPGDGNCQAGRDRSLDGRPERPAACAAQPGAFACPRDRGRWAGDFPSEGRKAIGGFVQRNQEFDDLEHFVRNVRQYDPYRPREHIERTVKYNMLQRADGKFVSKCDSTPAGWACSRFGSTR